MGTAKTLVIAGLVGVALAVVILVVTVELVLPTIGY